MGLPGIVSLKPLERLPRACLSVPGSKSITNRALVAAALQEGEIELQGALWSEDTRCMVQCLSDLGFSLSVREEAGERSNRAIRIQGQGGRIPRAGSASRPLELEVRNAGTVARFLMAMVCLGRGHYRLSGTERMHQRPQAGLVEALRQLGYRIESGQGRLPLRVEGRGPRSASCTVDIGESSQFASALLLSAGAGGWDVRIRGEGSGNAPYVEMTREISRQVARAREAFPIEPDASSGSYFWAANALGLPGSGGVSVARWPRTPWQADAAFPALMEGRAPLSRERDLGDSIMTAIVAAAAGAFPRRFDDLRRLRLQECERVEALADGLSLLGVPVRQRGESLLVVPASVLRPADIDCRNDHRIAMCFALLALRHPGIRLLGPSCVDKTFPDFFAKLAARPPDGLGAEVRGEPEGRILSGGELLAG